MAGGRGGGWPCELGPGRRAKRALVRRALAGRGRGFAAVPARGLRFPSACAAFAGGERRFSRR